MGDPAFLLGLVQTEEVERVEVDAQVSAEGRQREHGWQRRVERDAGIVKETSRLILTTKKNFSSKNASQTFPGYSPRLFASLPPDNHKTIPQFRLP